MEVAKLPMSEAARHRG